MPPPPPLPAGTGPAERASVTVVPGLKLRAQPQLEQRANPAVASRPARACVRGTCSQLEILPATARCREIQPAPARRWATSLEEVEEDRPRSSFFLRLLFTPVPRKYVGGEEKKKKQVAVCVRPDPERHKWHVSGVARARLAPSRYKKKTPRKTMDFM